jgi:hypothetical protein
VTGAIGGGATTIAGGGGGATTTGAAYTTGAGAEVVVVVFEVVSLDWANAMGTLPNSTAIPKDKATVFNECFTMMSPLVLQYPEYGAFSLLARSFAALIVV